MKINNVTKRMATIAGIVVVAGSLAVGVTFVSAQKEKSDVSSLLARNIVALAQNESGNGAAVKHTKTEEKEVDVFHFNAQNVLVKIEECKVLVTTTTKCEGTGNIPCQVGDSTSGTPYGCKVTWTL